MKTQIVIILVYLVAYYLSFVTGILVHPYVGVVLGALLLLRAARYSQTKHLQNLWHGRRRAHWAV